MSFYKIFQCASDATCLLQIWDGKDAKGPLLATYDSNNPAPLNKDLVFGRIITIKFIATDPAVRFMANWACAKGEIYSYFEMMTFARQKQTF